MSLSPLCGVTCTPVQCALVAVWLWSFTAMNEVNMAVLAVVISLSPVTTCLVLLLHCYIHLMPSKRTLSDVYSSDQSNSYPSSEDESDDGATVHCAHCNKKVSRPTERKHQKFAPIHDYSSSSNNSDTSSSSEEGSLVLAVPRMSTFISLSFKLIHDL